MRSVSIRDVAAAAGVAVGTVSRVLNDAPGVAPSTRERVQASISVLGYRPNRHARALSSGKTHVIGAVVPFFTHPSAVERLRGAVSVLEGSPYDLVLYNVGTTVQRLQHLAHRGAIGRADALLVMSLAPTDAEVADLDAAGVRCVLVDCEHPALPRVVTDDVAGGRMATEHLLTLGHQRVAFLGEPSDPARRFVAARQREIGYREALAAAGLEVEDALVRHAPHGWASARDAATALLAPHERPSAIFASSDTQALGVLEAAATLGLDVPGDVALIGFDDLEVAAHVGLSTVRQPLRESGAVGAQLLLDVLDAPAKLDDVPEIRLELELVARRTTIDDRSTT